MTDNALIPVLDQPSFSDDALRDRVILVTGANRGIGRAVAMRCAAAGARVVASGRDIKGLEKLDDQIQAAGGEPVSLLPLDLLKATIDDFRMAAKALEDNLGQLDGIAHVAGLLGEMSTLEHYPAMTWHNVMHVNVSAPFLLTQALLPLIKRSPGSSIVFASSSVGRIGRAHWGAYSVSKFATEGLMQTLADECDGQPRVNALNPGATRTLMRRSAYPAEDPTKLATPEDIAPAFAYLLSTDSAEHNGRTFDAQGPR
ncbi:MAG: YciK family oxidoreductase [Gammaproteobacteria bacterium]